MKKEILRMMVGFRKFREKFFLKDFSIFDKLSQSGQSPKTLMIACSDSRVDPAILFSSSPGEIFVVRNVANLVPPYELAHQGFHGVSAAIEFAVVNLKVDNIVVLGHRQCGGIRSLFQSSSKINNGFVEQWMSIANEAKNKSLQKFPDGSVDILCKECEQESIITSINNLRSFPFISEAIQTRNLDLIGAYFDLEAGQLWYLDDSLTQFQELNIINEKI